MVIPKDEGFKIATTRSLLRRMTGNISTMKIALVFFENSLIFCKANKRR